MSGGEIAIGEMSDAAIKFDSDNLEHSAVQLVDPHRFQSSRHKPIASELLPEVDRILRRELPKAE